MPLQKSKNDVPIEFCWATFCRAVLDKRNEKTLYCVMPSARVEVGTEAPEGDSDGSADRIILPFGDMAVYALFKRKAGIDGHLSIPVQFEASGLNFVEQTELTITMTENNIHSQQILNFTNVNLELPAKSGRQRKDISLIFKSGNVELGKVEVNFDITVVHQRSGEPK